MTNRNVEFDYSCFSIDSITRSFNRKYRSYETFCKQVIADRASKPKGKYTLAVREACTGKAITALEIFYRDGDCSLSKVLSGKVKGQKGMQSFPFEDLEAQLDLIVKDLGAKEVDRGRIRGKDKITMNLMAILKD